MSHQYADDECNECLDYVRPITNSQPWHCGICHITESALCVETQMWSRYELQCGHETHERCYRVWAKQHSCVGCNTCGCLEKVELNRLCDICDVWGHVTVHDCIVKQSRVEFMLRSVEAYAERMKYAKYA